MTQDAIGAPDESPAAPAPVPLTPAARVVLLADLRTRPPWMPDGWRIRHAADDDGPAAA